MDNKDVEINEKLYEEYFQKVKSLLRIKPYYSIRQICNRTGVSREYIEKYIKDGLLIMKDGKMSQPGNEENIEQDRRSKLIASFKEQLRVDEEKQSGDMSSQLVRDLRDLNERKKMSEKGREH